MIKKKHINLISKIALFFAAIVWGSSFFVMKNSVDVFPPHYLLAFRFTIAFILLGGLFYKKFRLLDKTYIVAGFVTATFLFLGYSFQTMGLTDTTPGKNAFLTAIYCVFVPFLYWAVDRSKPEITHYVAAFVCITGIGIVSLSGDLSIRYGDWMTIIGGLFYSGQIVSISKLASNKDPVLFTITQFFFAGIFAWIVAFFTETLNPGIITAPSLWGLIYLAVLVTAVALLCQNFGQQYTHPATASIILSLESVFGVLFSVLFYGEVVTPRLIVGFIVIFIAILISETKLNFIFERKIFEN